MEDDQIRAKYLLNDILRNINTDITTLRKDVQRLNDSLIGLLVKFEDTYKTKEELEKFVNKIDSILDRIIELEKSKIVLENLIETIKLNHSADHATFGNYITSTKNDKKIFIKIIAAMCVSIAIILYITESFDKFLTIFKKIIGFFLF